MLVYTLLVVALAQAATCAPLHTAPECTDGALNCLLPRERPDACLASNLCLRGTPDQPVLSALSETLGGITNKLPLAVRQSADDDNGSANTSPDNDVAGNPDDDNGGDDDGM
ncbi:hypothetical protein BD779DRAFT_1673738 [Infundibulicybe gibba]|nr:hypothetical protein BD779DRAFT_1673738 [Infundibulicybe gibba]